MNIKKLFLLLFMSLIGLSNMSAETREIIYSIDYNEGKEQPRSIIKKPIYIYQNDKYIMLSSTSEQSVHVTISDANGMVMKCETVVIEPGQDTLLYIGDLASGTYELTIETDSYTLYGSFEVE